MTRTLIQVDPRTTYYQAGECSTSVGEMSESSAYISILRRAENMVDVLRGGSL
jgi:hypothetical protein